MTDTAEEQKATEEAPPTAEPAELTLEERIARLETDVLDQLGNDLLATLEMAGVKARLKHVSKKVDELMTPPAPVLAELSAVSSENTHIRIQTTKNTKGYGFETVVAVDGAVTDDVVLKVEALLLVANGMAREECARLEELDADGNQ